MAPDASNQNGGRGYTLSGASWGQYRKDWSEDDARTEETENGKQVQAIIDKAWVDASSQNKEADKKLDEMDNGGESEVWYYVYEKGGMGHSLAYNPNTNTIYETQHPNYGTKRGEESWAEGDAKSQGYMYNMSNEYDFNRFWGFRDNRGDLLMASVVVNNPQAAIDFFEGNVGKEWDYNFVNNNCKHYVNIGLRIFGRADTYINGPFPKQSISGPYIYAWNKETSGPKPINPSVTPEIQRRSRSNNGGPKNMASVH
jgi:hypothetical protein